MDFILDNDWKKLLQPEMDKAYYQQLLLDVHASYMVNEPPIYPPQELVFNAFNLCPLEDIKVVILGQDPYHGAGQAHGLSFSVPDGIKAPPSLKNIYKEITTDIGTEKNQNGNLKTWAKQGVLLLNATLTVEAGKAGSHQGLGWETFTDAVIKTVSDKKDHVVFILWGKYAQAKSDLIAANKHLILKAPHPSPFSAHTGFFGCKHFSKTNEYLKQHGLKAIDW